VAVQLQLHSMVYGLWTTGRPVGVQNVGCDVCGCRLSPPAVLLLALAGIRGGAVDRVPGTYACVTCCLEGILVE
jgi:hypothetical protein